MSPAPPRDWQRQSIDALAGLTREACPAAELLLLDALAVHLMGPDAPEPPYTVEHGSAAAQHLLRAIASSAVAASSVTAPDVPAPDPAPDPAPGEESAGRASDVARDALVAGAHRFAERGGPGVQQLVTRFVAAAVGELEIHRESAEAQTRSLFYFGLLAVASGPENRLSQRAADGITEVFTAWDARIGDGFVPPWRVLQPS